MVSVFHLCTWETWTFLLCSWKLEYKQQRFGSWGFEMSSAFIAAGCCHRERSRGKGNLADKGCWLYTWFLLSSWPLESAKYLLFTSDCGRQRLPVGGWHPRPASPPAGTATRRLGKKLPFCHKTRKDFWVTNYTGLPWQLPAHAGSRTPAGGPGTPHWGNVVGVPSRSGRFRARTRAPHGLSPQHRAALPLTAPRRFPRLRDSGGRVPTAATAPPFRHFLVFLLLRALITPVLPLSPPRAAHTRHRPARQVPRGRARKETPSPPPARRMVAAAARSPGSPLAAARRGLARPRCHVESRGRRGRAGVGSLGAGAIGIGPGAERLRRGCTAARHPFSRPPPSPAPSPPPLFSSLLPRPREEAPRCGCCEAPAAAEEEEGEEGAAGAIGRRAARAAPGRPRPWAAPRSSSPRGGSLMWARCCSPRRRMRAYSASSARNAW